MRSAVTALIALWASFAAAQGLGEVSNLMIRGGFTPGFTESGPGVTNGTIRWNPATTSHQARVNGVWVSMVTGPGIELSTNRMDYGVLYWDPQALNHGYRIAPQALTSYVDWVTAYANTNIEFSTPGLLVKYSGDTPAKVYMLLQTVDHSLYAPNTTSSVPWFTDTAWWSLFSQDGTSVQGNPGASGSPGLSGIGNIQYGVYAGDRLYTYDTGTPIVVSHAGRWYDLTATVSNVEPSSASGTNFWAISVERGENGVITVYSNLVYRGAWDSGVQYTNLDEVTFSGNRVAVLPTNAVPALGESPGVNSDGVATNSAAWTVTSARGARGLAGATGAAGADGAVTHITNLFQLFTTISSNLFEIQGTAAATSPALVWVGSAGGTNILRWAGEAYVGTNRITVADGTNVVVNGVPLVMPAPPALIVSNVTPGDVSSYDAGTRELGIDTNLNLRSAGFTINGVAVTNGIDVTILGDGGFTNAIETGTGNVYTNAVVTGGTIEFQRGTVSGGGGQTNYSAYAAVSNVAGTLTLIPSQGVAQRFVLTSHVTNTVYSGNDTNGLWDMSAWIERGTNSINMSRVQWIEEPSWTQSVALVHFTLTGTNVIGGVIWEGN